jgi:hypothetical protein
MKSSSSSTASSREYLLGSAHASASASTNRDIPEHYSLLHQDVERIAAFLQDLGQIGIGLPVHCPGVLGLIEEPADRPGTSGIARMSRDKGVMTSASAPVQSVGEDPGPYSLWPVVPLLALRAGENLLVQLVVPGSQHTHQVKLLGKQHVRRVKLLGKHYVFRRKRPGQRGMFGS